MSEDITYKPSENRIGDTIRIEEVAYTYEPGRKSPDRVFQAEKSKATSGLSPDFARLVPLNDAAKKAFDEIARIMAGDPLWNPHVRKYIHVNDSLEQICFSVSDDNGGQSDIDEEAVEIFTGYYRLNLAILPDRFATGWLIGSGRPDLDNAGVDLLVTVLGRRDGVRGRHAQLFHHRESHVLMLKPLPKKTVIANGQKVNEEGQMLASTKTGITIGNLTFSCEFTRSDDALYRKQLAELTSEANYWFKNSSGSLDPTPSERYYEMQGYQFQTPQAAGTFGIVSACVRVSTGNVYAVKRVQRKTRKTLEMVESELDILRLMGEHPHVCSLIEVLYSDGDSVSMGDKGVNDVYMILQPLASHTFQMFLTTQTSDELTKVQASYQAAQGLRYIHSRGIIHRDIKPDNLLVSRHEPLHVVVADFGHATTELVSKDHFKGTIAYHPPEITALKNATDLNGFWSYSCDVFSLGKVMFELFKEDTRFASGAVNRDIFERMITILEASHTQMDTATARMLSWESAKRPKMRELLLLPFWPGPETRSTITKRIFAKT